jgi:hypothetical protein
MRRRTLLTLMLSLASDIHMGVEATPLPPSRLIDNGTPDAYNQRSE